MVWLAELDWQGTWDLQRLDGCGLQKIENGEMRGRGGGGVF